MTRIIADGRKHIRFRAIQQQTAMVVFRTDQRKRHHD